MSDLNNKVLLIITHNDKPMGLRCIANFLKNNGFEPTIVFMGINMYNPSPITNKELALLKEVIASQKFLYVGISILSCFTLQDAKEIYKFIKQNFNIPVIMGGAYVTSVPQEAAKYADIAIRGEGETSMLMLAEAFQKNQDWHSIPNLCYFDETNNKYIENELAPLISNIDSVGYGFVDSVDMYIIENSVIQKSNPLLTTEFYETACSRGCPYNCSYCCSSNVRRLYKNKGIYLRFRSVDNVISELKEAISKNPNIKEIRFWDEVFSSQKGWVETFTERYKKEIGIPFHIWGHPLMIKKDLISMLSDAGLKRIVVGIQSGSPNVRNTIFRRFETNEQIIKASEILSSFKIPEVYYDLMIGHPLESIKELEETFNLCLQLKFPFNLEIHGLYFLPGADITNIALKQGFYTQEDFNTWNNLSFQEQDKILRTPAGGQHYYEPKKEILSDLIFLTQFECIRDKVIKLSSNPYKNVKKIKKLIAKIEKIHNKTENLSLSQTKFIKKIANVFFPLLYKIKNK